MILVGCSGWSYRDWKERFYGKSNPSLQYYSHFFNAVEVDSTYYRMPSKNMVKSWVERFNPGIIFTLKMPGDISHGNYELSQKINLWNTFEESVIKTISRVQGSVKVLMTIPPGILDMEDYIQKISKITSSYENLCIEPRVKDPRKYESISKIVEDNGFIPVSIDNYFINLDKATGSRNVCYIRLHGRNTDFFNSLAGMEKFNYDYSQRELENISKVVEDATTQFQEVYVFFNNHPNGNAPLNAIALSRILGINKEFF